ncbi:MAG: glycosyltransferase family 2 protein [Cytophagaceae bacterium]
MSDAIISVIIPVHNRAHLIGETLDSLRSQLRLSDEIIVVDDHSNDYLKDVLQLYPEVILISSTQRGPGAARNAGLKIARGQYIQFLDSDDIVSNNKLSAQLGVFENYPLTDVVYGPFLPARKERDKWIPTDWVLQYYPLTPQPLIDIVAQGWCNIVQSCLFKREFLSRVGSWREDILTHEDKFFWFHVALLKPNIKHENKSLTIYRQHMEQITDKHLTNMQRTLNGMKVFEYMLQDDFSNKLSFHSRNILEGLLASYKKYMNNNGQCYSIGIKSHLCFYYYKIFNKLGRIKTNSSWQPMHGVERPENIGSTII